MIRQSSLVYVYALLLGGLVSSPAIAQTSPTAGAQATSQAQGGVATSPPAANAAGSASGSGAGSANAGNNSAALASGSSVNAMLTAPVDAKKSKPGDPVSARTTQAAQTESGAQIPKGSLLVGHVTEAHARAAGQANSAVGIAFDKAVTRDGHEIPLRDVGIQAVAAAEGAMAGSVMDGGGMMGAGGAARTAPAGGIGVLGGATGAAGAVVGPGLGAAGGAGTLAGNAGAVLRGSPGAIGGLNAAGMLSSNSSGVFGLDRVRVAHADPGTATGSLVTSSDSNVRLDRGTRMLLSSQSAGRAGATGQVSPPPTSDKSTNGADRRTEKSNRPEGSDKR